MPLVGFEPAIPVINRLQTHTLERAATGISAIKHSTLNHHSGKKNIYHRLTKSSMRLLLQDRPLDTGLNLGRMSGYVEGIIVQLGKC